MCNFPSLLFFFFLFKFFYVSVTLCLFCINFFLRKKKISFLFYSLLEFFFFCSVAFLDSFFFLILSMMSFYQLVQVDFMYSPSYRFFCFIVGGGRLLVVICNTANAGTEPHTSCTIDRQFVSLCPMQNFALIK